MLKASLLNNVNVFTHPHNDLGLCTHVEHTIELTDQKPVRMQPYSTSDANRSFFREETQEWIRRGIIRPSKCAYASPVTVVDQPHHETTPKRLCVDYRFLNAKTIKRAYLMPKVDTLSRKVAGSGYLSKLNVKKAFLNIPLHEEDISKAAFVTEHGHFEPL
ncbi:hypothetical protein MRX96_000916 [Rhipicephalus microplus]